MSEKKNEQRRNMEINWEQQKVISNPLRSRIIAMLYEEPRTPKQVADDLGKNPGTIYYHIQQLVKHDILEIDHVETDRGIVEKYYRSKAISFSNPAQEPIPGEVVQNKANIYLSKKLLDQLSEEIQEVLFKYGNLSYKEKDTEEQSPYTLVFQINEFQEEEEK